MPTNDFTSKLLDLEDADIHSLDIFDSEIHISFQLKRRTQTCPFCSALTDKVHDYRVSKIKDSPIQGKKVIWFYKKRRYHCNSCNKHFYEKLPLVAKYCRTTVRLTKYLLYLMTRRISIHDAAVSLGISDSTANRWLSQVSFPKPKHLPTVLSIDEFRGNTNGEKFQGILTNPEKHKVFDILPNRSMVALQNYFQEFKDRKNVKYFIMDMNRVYRDIARSYFPDATIVIDRFHVVRYVTWAFENVRKRVQKSMLPEKRKYFKRSRRLLLSHREKLSEENLQAVEVMLRQSPDLASAYYLKETFYDFMKSESRAEAGKCLQTFVFSAQVSGLKEFHACLTMLGNWSAYILNSFDCPYTNGFTEGTNNAIKVLKRTGFGYRNFNNFRNRILLNLS